MEHYNFRKHKCILSRNGFDLLPDEVLKTCGEALVFYIDETGKWHLIDIDAIVSASNTFMFSCIMAVGFLLEGYSAKWIKEQIIHHHSKE